MQKIGLYACMSKVKEALEVLRVVSGSVGGSEDVTCCQILIEPKPGSAGHQHVQTTHLETMARNKLLNTVESKALGITRTSTCTIYLQRGHIPGVEFRNKQSNSAPKSEGSKHSHALNECGASCRRHHPLTDQAPLLAGQTYSPGFNPRST